MPENESVSLVFDLMVQLCLGTGVDAKGKVAEFKVDGHWRFAVNGKRQEVEIAAHDGCMGARIPPYEVAIWFNGFLAGLIGPYGGVLAAGEVANEDAFIAALRACAEAKGLKLADHDEPEVEDDTIDLDAYEDQQ